MFIYSILCKIKENKDKQEYRYVKKYINYTDDAKIFKSQTKYIKMYVSDKQYYKIALKQVKLKRNLNLDCRSNLHLKTNGALLCEITFNFIQLKSKRTIIMRSNGFFLCKLV